MSRARGVGSTVAATSSVRRRRAVARAILASGALAVLTAFCGCAVPPATPPAPRTPPPAATEPPARPAEPGSGAQVGTTASGGTITVHPTPAGVDTTPSPEARTVLRTIPEPLGRESESESESESEPDTAAAPVPAPTEPLGDRPGSRLIAAPPESLATPPPAAAPSKSPPAARPESRPPTRAPAAGEPCWRVQVAVSADPAYAGRLAEAARSQLLVPFVVEREGGQAKVRSRDCLTGTAADDLRRRAVASGFSGTFRFSGKRP